jgi:predicted amidohydrolase
MAREFEGVSVLFGSTPRRLPSGDIINSAPLALSDGRYLLQDKLFVTPCEAREWKWKDGETLQVIEAPWGRTVILICHDIEVPGLSAQLVRVQPDLILTPSCTGSLHGLRRVRFCAQARAVEHHAWVLQTSTIQPASGMGGVATINMNEHTGQAAIIPPSESLYEEFRKEGPLNEGAILVGELDFRRTRKVRQLPVVFPARDERARKRMPEIQF